MSELYCPSHAAAICHLCASSEHRKCPQLVLFEKHVQELRDGLTDMGQKIESSVKKLNQDMAELDLSLLKAEDETKKSLGEIDSACDKLKNVVEEYRKQLKDRAVSSRDSVKTSVEDIKGDLAKRRGLLTSHQRLVERVRLTSPSGRLECNTSLLKNRISSLDEEITWEPTCVSLPCFDTKTDMFASVEKLLSDTVSSIMVSHLNVSVK
jgi:hypothetical protein